MNTTRITRSIAIIMTLNFAARGLTLPFVNVYLDSIGFTGTQIGTLVSLVALLDILLIPLLLTVVDRKGVHRRLLQGTITGTTMATFGLVATVNQFLLGGTAVLRDLMDKPNQVLVVQLTITKLEEIDRDIYGRLRAFGSLGWAITTFISGRIFAWGGYPLLFVLSALINLASLHFTRVLPTHTSGDHKNDANVESAPRSTGFYLFLVSEFLFWGSMMAFFAFIFIYMREDLGASADLVGVAISISALAEIPFMVIIDYLLRWIDVRVILLIGVVGLSLQFLAFALLTDTSLIIPLMLIRGAFYTFQTVSKTILIAKISHPANVSTNQSLAQVTVPSLAIILTGSASGWIYDNAGGDVLFKILTVIGLIAALWLVLVWRYLDPKAQTYSTRKVKATE